MTTETDVFHARIAEVANRCGLSYHKLTLTTGVVLKRSTYPMDCGCGYVVNEEALYQFWVGELGIRKAVFLGVYEEQNKDFIRELIPTP